MRSEEKVPYGEDRQIFYNMAVPGGAFVITAIILLIILNIVDGHLPHAISVFDFVLVILASYRMVRGASYDKLLRYVREQFKYKKEIVVEDGKKYVIKREMNPGWKKAIIETLECPWCTGFWTTLITLFIYFISSSTWIIILIFAVSGAASFIQLTINLIATKYEELDMKNEKTQKDDRM